MASSFLRFLDHTQRRTTVGRTPLDEWSARRRDLYLTTHNTHNKHPCPQWDSNPRSQQASGRRPTPIDHTATGTGIIIIIISGRWTWLYPNPGCNRKEKKLPIFLPGIYDEAFIPQLSSLSWLSYQYKYQWVCCFMSAPPFSNSN